jgi:P-type E1-E2 ATPase
VAFAYIKGAPERILAMCSRQRGPIGEEPLDRAFWRNETDAMARRGRRMLAVAVKTLPRETRDLSFADVEGGATALCLLGLIDPPRDEALDAIRECQEAGIAVKMITGDHAATAEAIARELKLAPEPKTITGQAIDRIDDAGLKEIVRDVSVFARTSPAHKLRLVTALQANDAGR